MSIQTKELDVNLLEAEFYEKPFYFSYSSLNKLLTAPPLFYKEYILKEREEKHHKYLLEGSLIHYLILENQDFDNKFLVTPDSLPSENSIQVIEHVFKRYLEDDDETLELKDYPKEILEKLEEMDLHQSLKDTKDGLGDDKRIAKIVEPKSELYFEFLKKQKGRIIIDSALLDECTRRADIIKTNSQMRELLGLDIVSDGKRFGVYNELPISIDAEGKELFGYKGVLDNMVIDVKNKLVRINDFKTTSKSLNDFEKSVDYFNYWLQASVYLKLISKFLSKVLTNEWTIEFRFIVFDQYNQLYAFPVSNETLEIWNNKFLEVQKIAKYHYTNKDFTLPYEYALGNVKL
jgi:hypothetical protein